MLSMAEQQRQRCRRVLSLKFSSEKVREVYSSNASFVITPVFPALYSGPAS